MFYHHYFQFIFKNILKLSVTYLVKLEWMFLIAKQTGDYLELKELRLKRKKTSREGAKSWSYTSPGLGNQMWNDTYAPC